MTPIRTDACDRTYVAEGCADLPALRTESYIATYWKPDAEELALLQAGFPVRLCIAGVAQPPVSVDVECV